MNDGAEWTGNTIFTRWQAKCPHDSKYVRYDVLEGDAPGCLVHWCYRCGAYGVTYQVAGTRSEWRQPKAAWAARRVRKAILGRLIRTIKMIWPSGIIPLEPYGTNGTFFTRCCHVAICDDERKCPSCGRLVIGHELKTDHERRLMRWRDATSHWKK